MIKLKEFSKHEMYSEILGLNHDHCSILYFGKVKNINDQYKDLVKNFRKKYCVIYDEEEPII